MNEGVRKQPDDEHEGPGEKAGSARSDDDGARHAGSTEAVGKRRHVRSRRMQEYLQQQDQAPPQKVRKCPFVGCEKLFSSGPGLRYHLCKHSSDTRRFSCETCKKEFKSNNGLKYHRDKTKCQDTHAVDAAAPSSPHPPSSPPAYPPSPSAVCVDRTSPTTTTATATITTTTTTTTKRRSSSEKDETDSMQTPSPAPLPHESPLIPHGWPEPRHRKMESRRKQMEAAAHHLKMEEGQDQPPLSLPPHHPPVRRPPHPLEHVGAAGESERLLEFANIATGPQSPLMRSETTATDWERVGRATVTEVSRDSTSSEGGFNACPPSTITPIICTITHPPATSMKSESEGNPVTSSSYSLPTSPKEWDCAQGLSHESPTAVWQCFITGTKVCLDMEDSSSPWYPVEVMARSHLQGRDPLPPKDLVQPVPLRLLSKQESADGGDHVDLGFESQSSLQSHLFARCPCHHPFFVRNKGWASCNPSKTKEVYGLPSSLLEIDDICLPSSHAQQPPPTKDSERSEVKSLELSSYVTLSKMAQKRSHESSEGQQSSDSTNGQKVPKAKRPMNAFNLWSQAKKAELIVKFPKTNHRDISSILAREWQKLSTQDKKEFHREAKMKAELQKKQHPDCWKRKHRVQH